MAEIIIGLAVFIVSLPFVAILAHTIIECEKERLAYEEEYRQFLKERKEFMEEARENIKTEKKQVKEEA